MSFLERPAPFFVVVGTFTLVFVPLLLLSLIPNFVPFVPYFALLEAIGLGTTHFFLTLAVYFHADHRAYFASSAKNRLIFFVAPLAIFGFYALTEATRFRVEFPVFSAYLFAGLRFFDFFHVGRQSVGMTQLWKRASQVELPSWLRGAENAFFVGLAGLQWQTFLRAGRFDPAVPYVLVPALGLCALFVAIVGAYARRLFSGEARLARPVAYFVLQAICAASAAYQTRLYLVALALHYAEYHVVMQPRCFYGKLDPSRAIDRIAAALRSRPPLFYGVLIAIVILFELRGFAPVDASPSTRFFVHLFDGIFFVHYFIEAFLWKFSEPFYRSSLGPLYFGQWPPPAPARAPRKPVWLYALAIIALLGLGTLAVPSTERSAALAAIDHRMADPLRADLHLRWGVQLAERGELAAARAHLLEAQKRDANDPRTKQALAWVAERFRSGQQ